MGSRSKQRNGAGVDSRPDVAGLLNVLVAKFEAVEKAVTRLHERTGANSTMSLAKEWYTTGELAAALGVTQFTVQVRWCGGGRIECEKDPDTGRWRIPAREYDRLVRGGSPRAGRKRR